MLLHRDKNCFLLVLFSLKWANLPYCSLYLPTLMLSSPFSSFLSWNNQIYWIGCGTTNQGNICKENTRKKHGKEENRSKKDLIMVMRHQKLSHIVWLCSWLKKFFQRCGNWVKFCSGLFLWKTEWQMASNLLFSEIYISCLKCTIVE